MVIRTTIFEQMLGSQFIPKVIKEPFMSTLPEYYIAMILGAIVDHSLAWEVSNCKGKMSDLRRPINDEPWRAVPEIELSLWKLMDPSVLLMAIPDVATRG
jgi:hypothetical protein